MFPQGPATGSVVKSKAITMAYFDFSKTVRMSHETVTVLCTREVRCRRVGSDLQTLAMASIPFSTGRDLTTCRALKTVQRVQIPPCISVQSDCAAALDRDWKSNPKQQGTTDSASQSNTSGLLFCSKHLNAFECLPACSERLCVQNVWCYLREGQGKS